MHLRLLLLVWMYILAGLLLVYSVEIYALPPLSLISFPLHGCGRINNLQYTVWGLAMCTLYWCIYIELCIAAF